MGFVAAIGLAWPSDPISAGRKVTLEAARLLMARGDFPAAERMLRELQGPEAGFQLGKLLTEQRRWREAKPPLLEALSSPERRPEALRLLAQSAVEEGDWESASNFLQEVEKAHPNDLKILKSLAVCQKNAGDHLCALSTAQRALSINPGDAELLALMGEAAEESSRFSARLSGRALHPMPQPLMHGRRQR